MATMSKTSSLSCINEFIQESWNQIILEGIVGTVLGFDGFFWGAKGRQQGANDYFKMCN
jgi:hypothetical protein